MNKPIFLLLILLILASCSKEHTKTESKESDNSLISALSQVDNEGFKRAEKIIDFSFPQDHGSHEDFKSEWWYFTGNLQGESEREFGYQMTIFRNALFPSDTKQSSKSQWQTNQIYMGHFGLSDIKNKKFYSFEILEREALDLSGYNADPFRVWIRNWSMESTSKELFPLKLHVAQDGISIDLELTEPKVIVLQGNKGLSQKSPEKGNASYYYSIPRILTKGKVSIEDKEYSVEGASWMDREWSTSSLSKEQEGWDWFSLQLDDGTELMYYQLRNKDGSLTETSSGSFVKNNGDKVTLALKDIELKVLETWKSDEHEYPSKWSMKIPSLGLDLIIEPKMQNQEHKFFIPYFEGAVKITGSHSGSGYVELTGY